MERVNMALLAAMATAEMKAALEALELVQWDNDAGATEVTVSLTGTLNGRVVPLSVTLKVGADD